MIWNDLRDQSCYMLHYLSHRTLQWNTLNWWLFRLVINIDIHTHFDAFLKNPVGLCCISRCRAVIIFYFIFLIVIIVSFPRCTVLYIGISFFCTITGWECKSGKNSSTFIFMWSKQWEGAFLWCTNLVIVSWLNGEGLLHVTATTTGWFSQITDSHFTHHVHNPGFLCSGFEMCFNEVQPLLQYTVDPIILPYCSMVAWWYSG